MSKYLKSIQLKSVFYNTIKGIIEDVTIKKYNFDDPKILHRYIIEKSVILLKDITIRFNLKEI